MILASLIFWLLLRLMSLRDPTYIEQRVEPMVIVKDSPRVDTRQNILVYEDGRRVID